MDELKDQIPNLSNEKTSSFVAVATSARDYIVHLKSKIYHLEREMERLGHVNSEYKRAAVAAGVSLNIYGVTGETEVRQHLHLNHPPFLMI